MKVSYFTCIMILMVCTATQALDYAVEFSEICDAIAQADVTKVRLTLQNLEPLTQSEKEELSKRAHRTAAFYNLQAKNPLKHIQTGGYAALSGVASYIGCKLFSKKHSIIKAGFVTVSSYYVIDYVTKKYQAQRIENMQSINNLIDNAPVR